GRPSDTPVCYLCTCEQCGNILNYGTCMKCNSGTGNSFTYDPIPESFDEVQIIPNLPPQRHFNIYLCQICESNSHYGYECSQRVPLVYEPEPCYIQNFSDNDYSHDLPGVDPLINHHCCYKCGNSLNDLFCHLCTCEFCGNDAHVGYNCPAQVLSFQTLPSFPQQYPCCEDCRGLSEADHCQPIQYTFIKKHEEEQAANARYWKIPACCDDDDDYNFAITPNEPVDSLSTGDEHLNTILAIESDEFIKSSVENLVPNPKEFVSKNSNADVESFSPSPIPVEDSDSFIEEIDLSFNPDYPMPPGIEEDDYDSERDIPILEELLDNYSLSLPEIESYHFDIPSFSRPHAKPPDGYTGILNIKMIGDISEQNVPMPGLMITCVSN
nr:hypothetical protein [Tanacetum cinerariifolium]